MNRLILLFDRGKDSPVHIMMTLVNELGLTVSQSEQLTYFLTYKDEICIRETNDTAKMLFAISVLDAANIKYKVL